MLKNLRPIKLAALGMISFLATFMVSVSATPKVTDSVGSKSNFENVITLNGEPANAINWCPEVMRYEVNRGNSRAIYHQNNCGKVYILMNASAAKDLAYDIKQTKRQLEYAAQQGGLVTVPWFMRKIVRVVKFGVPASAIIGHYAFVSDDVVNKLERAADRSDNIWFDTQAGALFHNPEVKY